MTRLIDLTNKRFGRLTVLERGGDYKPRIPMWKCHCECGNETSVLGASLRYGLTTSCGCLRNELNRKRFVTHGQSGRGERGYRAPEYSIWNMMIQRCTNPKVKGYKRYGGRGISVCDRWADFAAFFADMGPRPSKRHTIERIDNSGDYTAVNCAWVTKRRQANNRRSNRLINFRGRDMTLRQIMEETNCLINFRALRARVFEKGWSVEDALSRPLHGH